MQTPTAELETGNPKLETGTPHRPGRPPSIGSTQIKQLVLVIAERGLSDSAAARACSLSTSSLSRAKQQDPELTLALFRAREEFRRAQLDIILEASANPRTGWRAAAWLLERIFPADYCPRAKDREKFRQLEAQEEAELNAGLDADPSEPCPEIPKTPRATSEPLQALSSLNIAPTAPPAPKPHAPLYYPPLPIIPETLLPHPASDPHSPARRKVLETSIHRRAA